MGDAARPADHWHGHPPDTWRARWGVPDLRIYEQVGSTNDIARTLAEAGAAAGTTVLADAQTRGRGQRGREWRAGSGRSLLLSMVLRPEEHGAADRSGAVLPLRVGLATARAIERVTGLHLEIKWPNDLLVRGRKVGGVLCEGALEGGRRLHVVAGIGINVLQQNDEWPPDLAGRATSLAAEGHSEVPMPRLAGEVIGEVRQAAVAMGALLPDELRAIHERDALAGQSVTVDGHPAGIAAGIDHLGALLVEREGSTHRIINGTIRIASGGTGESRAT